jgi:hypothetical protein
MTRLGRRMLMSALIESLENLDDGELSEVAATTQRLESTRRVLRRRALCTTNHEWPHDAAPTVPIPDPETVN